MLYKFKEFLVSHYDEINLVILIYVIVITIFFIRIWQLYYPQSTIVLHDYGRVFESEIDWKIWRLEHEGK